ncbi:MAG: hypothetical protein ACFFC7_26860 [Candidatus Hermodarchaeota archaeon]
MQKKAKTAKKIGKIEIPEAYFTRYYVPDESHQVSDSTFVRQHKRLVQWLKDHPEK